jgi:Na+/melibiose symporter-like transporter
LAPSATPTILILLSILALAFYLLDRQHYEMLQEQIRKREESPEQTAG